MNRIVAHDHVEYVNFSDNAVTCNTHIYNRNLLVRHEKSTRRTVMYFATYGRCYYLWRRECWLRTVALCVLWSDRSKPTYFAALCRRGIQRQNSSVDYPSAL